MGLIVFVAGIIVVHVMVAGMVRQMRREGQRLRRYHLLGFAALEVAFGLLLVLSDGWSLFVFLAGNALFVLLQGYLPQPKRPV